MQSFSGNGSIYEGPVRYVYQKLRSGPARIRFCKTRSEVRTKNFNPCSPLTSSKFKSLRLDIRYLLIFAHIRWMNGDRSMQDYVIFVFQSIILLMPAALRTDCKAKWIRLIPINEVELEEHTKDDCLLTLIHMAFKGENGQFSHGKLETVYQMACCQAVLKQQILKSIKKAKANYIRENKRPLSGSSQSDGGYGSESSKDRKMS